MDASELIHSWLAVRLSPAALAWIDDKAARIAAGAPEKTAFPAFSAAVRHAGKEPLDLDAPALQAAGRAVEGWDPSDWTADQAARILLLLALPPGEASARILTRMYQTADVGEAVALQKSLPLLPDPEAHMAWAREGIRSNIKLVFEAVALRNPYPARRFDETGWNQLVTKTFFVESPMDKVWGLDSRVNPALGQILTDLAEERWAAGRTFSPLLWRCVGPVAGTVPGGRALKALEKVLAGGSVAERRAAALALASCRAPEAARLLASAPELAASAKGGRLTWENFDAV